jgi:hypothetical protein
MFKEITAITSVLVAVLAAPRGDYPEIFNSTVWVPPSWYNQPRVFYARTIELFDQTMLMTWENYSPEPPLVYAPIFKSTNHGATWEPFVNVTDQKNGWGLRYQPQPYQLRNNIGEWPAGTIILGSNSIPANLSQTQIDVYASKNNGNSWQYVSTVASGGEAIPDNGMTPVWEPFFEEYDGGIVCHYSDQGDPDYGQKLAHKFSQDLLTWGPEVNDVTAPEYADRPGMTTVTQMSNGKWLMTFEYGGGPAPSDESWFPVYYKIADSPLEFESATPMEIIASDGNWPWSTPTVTYSTVGGKNGTIIVSALSHSGVFINQALGAVSEWKYVPTRESNGYSRYVYVLPSNHNRVAIAGAGTGENDVVKFGMYDVKKLVAGEYA